jgi:membrane-bound transcription factor site-1 protease
MEQSGTSMASPVIAGAVSLIVSSVPFEKRSELVNPASVKQVLIESAVRLVRGGVGLFEQGAGKLNLPGAVALMQSYQPRMSFHPPYLDTSECPYFSPYCEQPLFYSSMPLIFNATLLNGISVTGKLASAPSWEATSVGGQHLRIQFDWSQFVWPWTGHVGMRIVVAESGKSFQGLAEGVVTVAVKTPLRTEPVLVKLPIRVRVIPTPARRRRLLWDQYHNSRYPPGYFPRDDLQFMASPFDWNADHIHTNFLPLFRALRKQGYFVEVLGEPWTCFDARNYAALLVVDPEEELWEEEQRKLEIDMRTLGLSLLVLADWYNVDVMKKLRFQDQNTQQQWTPVTGGAHLPALNEFLEVFGVAFSTRVVRGLVTINGRTFDYASGATIGAFPKDAHLLSVEGENVLNSFFFFRLLKGLIDQRLQMVEEQSSAETEPHAIGGWFQLAQPSGGRVAVFGDSSFVDSSGRAPSREDKSAHRGYWMLEDVMAFLAGDLKAEQVKIMFFSFFLINQL